MSWAAFSEWGRAICSALAVGWALSLLGGSAGAQAEDCSKWVSPLAPTPRDRHAMAYDAARGVTVLFGGRATYEGGEQSYRETWEFDGGKWGLRATEGPAEAWHHAMAFDAARAVTVLVNVSGTWEWDGDAWTLRTTGGPKGTSGSAAYDSARAVTVLVDSEGTWEWDGSSWTLRTTGGPSPRIYHAVAYDAARAVTVLFGGCPGKGWAKNDTWEWDGTTWNLCATGGLPARGDHSMAYDIARKVVVLFGGYNFDEDSRFFGDTWEWNGSTWTFRTNTGPGPRDGAAMVYDAAQARSLMFGGPIHCGWHIQKDSDVWRWDGDSWRVVSVGPSARSEHAMVCDEARAVTVLFGGYDGTKHLADTWGWDGMTWTVLATEGPSARSLHAMAYDSGREVTILFGGHDGAKSLADTWEWDGSSWTLRATEGPSGRAGHAMAYDASRGVTVLFGGTGPSLHETWEWDGSHWLLRDWEGIAWSEPNGLLTYDSAREVCVLVLAWGSIETWEWDGVSWHPRAEFGEEYFGRGSLAYDVGRGVTVLMPYGLGAKPIWEWDGTAWVSVSMDFADTRDYAAMSYDSMRKALVFFGGRSCLPMPHDQTWELQGHYVRVVKSAASLTLNPGEAAAFSVEAVGDGPLAYHWRKDGVALVDDGRITGTTTPELSIDPVKLADSGSYDVVVSQPDCAEISAAATLTVEGLPGDLNCDGVINAFDIDLFVVALTKPSQYGGLYPDCEWTLADINGDGFVDAFDIDPFVDLLTGE